MEVVEGIERELFFGDVKGIGRGEYRHSKKRTSGATGAGSDRLGKGSVRPVRTVPSVAPRSRFRFSEAIEALRGPAFLFSAESVA
jgi:hypothetical protein